MSNAKLSDEKWDKIFEFLKMQTEIYIGTEKKMSPICRCSIVDAS